jgi:LmbE family N-acetylglucosaminyl deacetylase
MRYFAGSFRFPLPSALTGARSLALKATLAGLSSAVFVTIIGLTGLSGATPNDTTSDFIQTKLALDALPVTGSVLMIAAHPDDENTGLLSYLARGRKVRTAYLSLTRGEGGQNVIGPEQGPDLGILRTQELLQSRRIDGAQQFFSRAIDFGFSKSPQEAIDKWGHDAVLGDIVWVIRKFQPDVIILQFQGNSQDGHGQHQASAILGREAWDAAADPKRFSEQLKYVKPWRAARMMVNRRAFTPEMQKQLDGLPGKLDLEIGGYDPLIGYSYGELAGISRSFNSSQSDGTPRFRGSDKTTLVTLKGTEAKTDLFDGIDLTWNRYEGGAPVGALLRQASREFTPDNPTAPIQSLVKARELVVQMKAPEVRSRLREIDEAIAKCSGLWFDFSTDREQLIPGEPFKLKITAIARTALPVQVNSLEADDAPLKAQCPFKLELNKIKTIEEDHALSASHADSQPYWLRSPIEGNRYQVEDPTLVGLPQNPPFMTLKADLTIGTAHVVLERPVIYRYMDRLHGESIKPVAIVPAVSIRFLQQTQLFPSPDKKAVEVEVTSETTVKGGHLRLVAPAGWTVEPASQTVDFGGTGEERIYSFIVTPTKAPHTGELMGAVDIGGHTIAVTVHHIDYPHIPLQTLLPPAEAKLVRVDAKVLARKVGYVMGAGDDVPDALRQLGCDVVLLGPNDLSLGDLQQYDAIVTGIRAFTERPDLVANHARLLEYVNAGGTLVVQYNRIERGSSELLKHMGPYPFEIGNQRVTVEEAPVVFDEKSPLVLSPNKITEKDFAGWIQERGLYFSTKWDSRYGTPFETHDPGDKPMKGATLVARYGKGVYIFTAFSWFRELPAGVPGAFRLFANLLSASKTFATAPVPTGSGGGE